MSIAFAGNWGSIHPSAYQHANGPLRAVEVSVRPGGALRYRCPVNGSLVLRTDDATIDRFEGERMRLRCLDCGETHLLTRETEFTATSADGP